MIRLHTFPGMWGINPSPFCLKVETYCRLAGILYQPVEALPFRAPRGKLPFIEDDRALVPDSGLIIEHLKARHGDPLDGDLDESQRALGHLLRRTCEESLYFVLVYSRWIDPIGWAVARPTFFGPMPILLRDVVAVVARRGVRRSLYGQGYGRHSADEIYALGAADLAALAELLSRHSFAVADVPSSIDASVYGVLANILIPPIETPLQAAAQQYPALTRYVARMQSRLTAA